MLCIFKVLCAGRKDFVRQKRKLDMIGNIDKRMTVGRQVLRFVRSVRLFFRKNRYIFASFVIFMAMTFAISGQSSKIQMATAFAYSSSDDIFHLSYHFPDGGDVNSYAGTKYVQNVASLLQENSDNFLKLNAEDVYAVFNKPNLERRDLGVVVWQYRSKNCVLDLYFDAGKDDADLSIDDNEVIHYDMRKRDKVKLGADMDKIAQDVKSRKSKAGCVLSIFYKQKNNPLNNEFASSKNNKG